MKIVKLILLILTVTTLMLVSQLSHGRHAALLIDADSGDVLYELEANQSWYPASLTKLMTLYMTFSALESGRIRLSDHLTISSHAARQPTSKLGLKPWDSISVEDAILAIVTRSANDAAVVLAERLAGSERQFAIQMTSTAHGLGMYGSHFMNATGLPHDWQTTTAHDMAQLAWKITHNFPQYYGYFGVDSLYYGGREFHSTNKFVANYPGAEGMKTGYTCGSGHNLVATAKQYGRRLIGVVLGGMTSSERYEYMFDMMDNGFSDRYGSYRSKNLNSMGRSSIGTPPYQLSCGHRPSSHYSARNDDDDDQDDRPIRYVKKTPHIIPQLGVSHAIHPAPRIKPIEKIYTIRDHKISVSSKQVDNKEQARITDKKSLHSSKKIEKVAKIGKVVVSERKTKAAPTAIASKTNKKSTQKEVAKTKRTGKSEKPVQIAKASSHSKGYYVPDSKSTKTTASSSAASKNKRYYKPESVTKTQAKSANKSKRDAKKK